MSILNNVQVRYFKPFFLFGCICFRIALLRESIHRCGTAKSARHFDASQSIERFEHHDAGEKNRIKYNTRGKYHPLLISVTISKTMMWQQHATEKQHNLIGGINIYEHLTDK